MHPLGASAPWTSQAGALAHHTFKKAMPFTKIYLQAKPAPNPTRNRRTSDVLVYPLHDPRAIHPSNVTMHIDAPVRVYAPENGLAP